MIFIEYAREILFCVLGLCALGVSIPLMLLLINILKAMKNLRRTTENIEYYSAIPLQMTNEIGTMIQKLLS